MNGKEPEGRLDVHRPQPGRATAAYGIDLPMKHYPQALTAPLTARLLAPHPASVAALAHDRELLAVKTREIVYLLFKQLRAPSLPILQSLHGRKMP